MQHRYLVCPHFERKRVAEYDPSGVIYLYCKGCREIHAYPVLDLIKRWRREVEAEQAAELRRLREQLELLQGQLDRYQRSSDTQEHRAQQDTA